ncbi:hypothetical protein K402DRAFT_401267 [Aulographum hederae CBS 113979]|uniref:RING-type E3 ubiquitin transferase n=1 Tax=Aulographum hederae CBS 113979 TaxID=1176131 RepID=A0A6G1HB29_9PEZI|nr:hypothetical protein K402DRAFT_401267 [Aulographum hederae CBS 113979]
MDHGRPASNDRNPFRYPRTNNDTPLPQTGDLDEIETWVDFLRRMDRSEERGSNTDMSTADEQSTRPVASHPLLSGHAAQSQQTGSQNAERAQETHRSMIAERKRRHTGSDDRDREASNSRRTIYMPNPSFMRAPDAGSSSRLGQGNSSDGAIDLTSSPSSSSRDARSPASRTIVQPNSSMRRAPARQESDIVLPKWQPDADVTSCPVCGTAFSFWFRKHHCRKCGRVVCASCSPHRITIPRQFIVHPPAPDSMSGMSSIIDLTGDEDDGVASPAAENLMNPALGGGEIVRVCNPCVPDPNFSPPPQRPTDQLPPSYSRFPLDAAVAANPSITNAQFLPPGAESAIQHPPFGNTSGRQDLPPVPPQPHLPPIPDYPDHPDPRNSRLSDPFRDRRVTFNNRSSLSDLWPPPPPPPHDYPSSSSSSSRPYSTPSQAPALPRGPNIHAQNYHFSNHPSRFHRRASASTSNVASAGAPHPPPPHRGPFPSQQHYRSLLSDPHPPPPPPPRREIAEEDECPVCGNELPPKGPNGSEKEREAHVDECIRTHFTATNAPSPAPGRGSASAQRPTFAGSRDPGIGASSSAPAANSIFGFGGAPGPAILNASPSAYASGSASSSSTNTGNMPGNLMMEGIAPGRPRGRRNTGNRMLVYKATEKDCVGDEEGLAQECVICFEEFEEGEEMGRLECLCKFHKVSLSRFLYRDFQPFLPSKSSVYTLRVASRCSEEGGNDAVTLSEQENSNRDIWLTWTPQTCIRQWWDTKGVGSCPTHQLHD